VYGDPVPSVTPGYSGFVLGEGPGDLTTQPTCTTTYAQVATSVPGNYATSCSGGVSSNYSFSYVAGNFHVDKAPLTVTADDQSKVLSAPNPAPLTMAYSGFVYGQGPADLTTQPTCTTTAAQFSPVSDYPIACSGGASGNYSFSYVDGNLHIGYALSGLCLGSPGHQILQPINDDGSSIFKKGSTAAAKFRVCDADGVSIGTPGVVVAFTATSTAGIECEFACVPETIVSTTPDTAFRWDPTAQQWIFNISTKNLQANRTYCYTISLNDGTQIRFEFGLK